MKKAIHIISVSVLCIVVIVSVYLFFMRSSQPSVEDSVEITEVQKLTTRNLDTNYPETPREVVKFYSRIICAYYSENYTDEELLLLGDQALALFDEKLLENNPRDSYFESLKAEIEEYRADDRRILSWGVSKSSDITYDEVNGNNFAFVNATYFLHSNTMSTYAKQTYELRKDAQGRWKILAFYKTNKEESDE